MKRIATLLLAGAVLSAFPPAEAQPSGREWRRRVEIFGDAGHSGFYNGDNHWGSGADFGGGVGIRPFSGALQGLGFELRGARLAVEEGDMAHGSSLRSRMIAVNALYHFRGRRRVQPFLYGGIGVADFTRIQTCDQCVYAVDPATGGLTPVAGQWETKDAKAGLTLGGGVKIALTRRISIRPELSLLDTTPGSGWNLTWVRATIGVGFHF